MSPGPLPVCRNMLLKLTIFPPEELHCKSTQYSYSERNTTEDFHSEHNTRELTCSVNYYGRLKPRLTWWFKGEEQADHIVKDTDDDRYVHEFTRNIGENCV